MKNLKLLSFFIFLPLLSFAQSYQLDLSYGQNGHTGYKLDSNIVWIFSGNLVNPGNIIISGSKAPNEQYFKQKILLVSYDEKGDLNEDFGIDGSAEIDLGSFRQVAHDQILLPDGSLCLTGTTANETFTIKVNPDGTLDDSFAGGTGQILTLRDPFNYEIAEYTSLVSVQSDGKIIASSYIPEPFTNSTRPVIQRYTPEGILDETFALNGNRFFTFNDIDLFKVDQNDYLFMGSVVGEQILTVLRIFPDGNIDWSFGDQGKFGYEFPEASSLLDIKFYEDGSSLILCHESVSTSYGTPILFKLNSEGQLDSSFGIDGKVTLDSIGGNVINPQIEILKDGRIIMGGGYVTAGTFNGSLFLTEFSKDGDWIPYSENHFFYTAPGNNIRYSDANLIVDEEENIFLTYCFKTNGNHDVIHNYGGVAKFIPSEVGTKDIELAIETQLSPNPASSSVILNYQLTSDQELSISLLDANGKLIQNIRPASKQLSGTHQQEISLSPELAAGIYFVQLKTNKGVKAIPLSIQ